MNVHPRKCQFVVDKINFLGHRVSAKGLSSQHEKIEVVCDLLSPIDIFGLRSALGLFSYFRKFVLGFCKIVTLMHPLWNKEVMWHLGAEQHKYFTKLEEKLCTADKDSCLGGG